MNYVDEEDEHESIDLNECTIEMLKPERSLTPDDYLWYAVFFCGVKDALEEVYYKQKMLPMHGFSALYWLNRDEDDGVGSVAWFCDVYGFEPYVSFLRSVIQKDNKKKALSIINQLQRRFITR
jgi:hypothetical protein